jgi:hypothetical protein
MHRAGDASDGFEVEVNDWAHTLYARAWGFWGAQLAAKFAPAVMEACQAGRTLTSFTLDARGLKPQREPGQEAIGALFAALRALGILRATVSTDSSLTRLQLLRIVQERAVKDLVHIRPIDEE